MMDKRAEYIETDAYQSRINSELDALGIAGDSDAERMIGMRIIEEINQTLFTELMEKSVAKKRGELTHERPTGDKLDAVIQKGRACLRVRVNRLWISVVP
ncbi:invasion plasmid antigen / internalinputative [Salmonella bongori]|nr:invasion plasmid antigen / internalinputative [Salmonella bongori]